MREGIKIDEINQKKWLAQIRKPFEKQDGVCADCARMFSEKSRLAQCGQRRNEIETSLPSTGKGKMKNKQLARRGQGFFEIVSRLPDAGMGMLKLNHVCPRRARSFGTTDCTDSTD